MSHGSLKAALEAVGFKTPESNSAEEPPTSVDQPDEFASGEYEELQRLKQHRPGRLLLEPGLFRPVPPSGSSIFRVYHHPAGYPLLQWWGRDGIGLPVQGSSLQRHLTDIDLVIKGWGFDAVPRTAFWINASVATTKAGKPCLRQERYNPNSVRSILASISLPPSETFEAGCEIIKTLRQSALDAALDMGTLHLVVAGSSFRTTWGGQEMSNFSDLLEDKWGASPPPS